MNCDFCYNQGVRTSDSLDKIRIDVYERFLILLRDFLKTHGYSAIILYHGGEPLLPGIDFLESLCEMGHNLLRGMEVKFVLQSNLTVNVSNKLVDLAYRYLEGEIGTSFDPYTRKLRGSFEDFRAVWEKNVRFLIKSGVYVSVNVVLTRLFYEDFDLFKETVNYLRSLGISSIHLERLTPTGKAKEGQDLLLNDREFFELFNKILDFYVEELKRGEIFYLNPLEAMIRYSSLGAGVSCWSGLCIMDTVTLETDGSIYGCPEMRARGSKSFGNVLGVRNFDEIFFSEKRIAQFLDLSSGQNSCEYFHICHRGCPSHPHRCDLAREECLKFFRKVTSLGDLRKLFEGVKVV